MIFKVLHVINFIIFAIVMAPFVLVFLAAMLALVGLVLAAIGRALFAPFELIWNNLMPGETA